MDERVDFCFVLDYPLVVIYISPDLLSVIFSYSLFSLPFSLRDSYTSYLSITISLYLYFISNKIKSMWYLQK